MDPCIVHIYQYISNKMLRYTVYFVSSLLGVFPACDLWMPTFRKYLSVPSSNVGYIQPLTMEQIDGYETSAFINHTPWMHPKDYSQYSKQGESLKSRTVYFVWKLFHMFRVVPPPIIRLQHPQHTQTSSNSSTLAAGSSNSVTNTRCCRYSCLRSWWWVMVPPEACRAVSR
jgi:hypothetical protein